MTEENNGYKVPLTRVLNVRNHSNADSLDFATVYGFDVICGRNNFKVNDLVIYVPVDSLLYNRSIINLVFPPEQKIKFPSDRRIRQAKIRGQYSQGLLIKPELLEPVFGPNWWKNIELETDLSAMLEIIKYEPPQWKNGNTASGQRLRDRANENPRFHKYGGLTNIKWQPDWFTETEEVVIQEKLHGSNCRFSIQPTAVNTKWRKVLRWVKMLPEKEFCYGSNNVQLQQRNNYTGFYGEDVYAQAVKSCDGFNKLKLGETAFGELICEGIQKNYHYGKKTPHFVLFDVKVTKEDGSQVYLDPNEVEEFAKTRGFDFVPVLYKGLFNKAEAERLSVGTSVYFSEHKVREGCVVKATKDYENFGQKKGLKLINPSYLADDNTDFH